MLNKKKNNKGFTLVELLVVIAIIGVLAVVAVPSLFGNIQKSHAAKIESDYNAMRSGIMSYYADNSAYPTVGNGGLIENLVTNGYLEGIKPSGNTYITPANGTYQLKLGVAGAGNEPSNVGDVVLVLDAGEDKTYDKRVIDKLIKDLGTKVILPADANTDSRYIKIVVVDN